MDGCTLGLDFELVVSSATAENRTHTVDGQPLMGFTIASGRTLCGSITLMGYPSLANDRRLVSRDRVLLINRYAGQATRMWTLTQTGIAVSQSGSCANGTVPASYVSFS